MLFDIKLYTIVPNVVVIFINFFKKLMYSNIFDKLSFLSLFLVIILLPVFFLPFTNIPIETSKGLLLVLGLALSLIFWALARLSDGKIIFPKSWLLVSGLGVVLAFLLSALFSKNSEASLFGTMFDAGSFWFIFSGFVLMFMSSIVFRTSKRARIVLLGIILSLAFVLIFQSFHLFMPRVLSLGILTDKTGNILGSWNALGLFAGFSCLMFLLVAEFFPVSKIGKLLLQILILLSMSLMAVVNFPLAWILLGISSLIIFVYKTATTFQKSKDREGENSANDASPDEAGKKKKHFPWISFIVVIVSLLFFMSGKPIRNFIPNLLQISSTEVNPDFGTTMSITKEVLLEHPVFGIGPNRFEEAWSRYKPVSINTLSINNVQFWDVSFSSGSGLLPTLTSTIGGLGILTWLVFIVLFLVIGLRSVSFGVKNGVNWEMMAFFVLSLYLFISSFFYFTGAVMFLILFAFVGVLIGLIASNSKKEISISFLSDYRKSFFSILILILVIILSAAISFRYTERLVSVSYFRKSLSASTLSEAEKNISRAVSLYSNDLYLRAYSEIYLVKLNSIVKKGSTLSDADKMDLQTTFDQALNSAQMAVAYNSSNYLNFLSLGSVYRTAGSLGVKDAYVNAVSAFQNASDLNPLNPGLKLAMAKAVFADGKIQNAKDYANSALSLKPDYIDALITLSQIAKSENDNEKALSYGQAALSLDPTDKNLKQYVDSLNKPASPSVSAPTLAPNEPKE